MPRPHRPAALRFRSRSACSGALSAHLKSVRWLRNAPPGSLSAIAASAAELVRGSSGSVLLVLVYGHFGKIVQKAECVLPKISARNQKIDSAARTASYCSFAYSVLVCFRMGISLVGVFRDGEATYGFVSWIRTTVDSECTRSTASLLPSGDQWNWTIWSDLKFVI